MSVHNKFFNLRYSFSNKTYLQCGQR